MALFKKKGHMGKKKHKLMQLNSKQVPGTFLVRLGKSYIAAKQLLPCQ